ncbi:response regulator [Sphingosinicella terrae]|uniref:response regulator n=1 Tax=Sphingosinicella terrae TaxID=2172047 RepID=UPI000E0D59F0|nr:response regulator [Sphingosinicella terrae]
MAEETFIAIVEDDAEIGALVAGLLRREGFAAEWMAGGAELDRLRARRRIDLVVLDLMLPGEDGLSICRRLRAEGEIPVLMVTARGDDVDRIVGLEVGADDYLAKPFNPRELVARARAILRRTRAAHSAGRVLPTERYRFASFVLDAGARALAAPDGAAIELTGGEFDLLLTLVRHPQRVLGRDQLLDWTRGRSSAPFDRSIDVQIARIRRKLAGRPGSEGLIKTVRGGGYVLTARVERP